MEIIGHKGACKQAPENTLSSFRIALEMKKCDGIEFDIQLSKDGELFVFHDWDLEKAGNSTGRIMDIRSEELQALDVGSWYSKEFEKEKIPLLKEVLDIMPDDIMLNIEFKEELSAERGGEKKLAMLLKSYENKNIVVSSFSHNLLANINILNPQIKLGLLTGTTLLNLDRYIENLGFDVHSFHPYVYLANGKEVALTKSMGIKTYVWTVNKIEHAQRMKDIGVDGIISDYPERFHGKF